MSSSQALQKYNSHFFNIRPVYAFGAWMLDNLPPFVGYAITRGCSEIAYLLTPGQRRDLTRNVRHVLSVTRPELSNGDGDRLAASIAHRIFWNRGTFFADLSSLSGNRPLRSLLNFTVEGDLESLARHVSTGRGAVLVSAHLGNWHAGSVVLGRRGVPVRSVQYGNHAAELMYRGVQRRAGIGPIYIGDDAFSVVEIVRAVRGGQVIAMLSDKPWDSRWVELPFFGRPSRFPIGAVRIARLAQAPIYPAFNVWTRAREYRAIIKEPIWVTGSDPDEAEREALLKLIRVYEEMITAWLPLWFNFSPVW